MPMTQDDIRQHYEKHWHEKSERAVDDSGLGYSSPVEDAVFYPKYQEVVSKVKGRVNQGSVLDVGCGSGRWIRFFLDRYLPERLTGIDFTESSIALLNRWAATRLHPSPSFRVADIADAGLSLGERFDWINVANVLFHIPEQDRFMAALGNLASLVSPTGHIAVTEYLPRATMRTEWMLVRSRYEFEAAVRSAGLRIVTIEATTFFANDPMGLDGPDTGVRQHFAKVRGYQQQILSADYDENARSFLVNFMADTERAVLEFCRERLADVEMPSQKLVILARAD